MRPKTKILALALAAAVLTALITQATGKPAAKVDDSDVTEVGPAPAFTRFNQKQSARVTTPPSALDEQYGPTAGASGSGAPVTVLSPAVAPETDDEEDLAEDAIYASEPSQQFLQWRQALADEAPDRIWADQLRGELARGIEARAGKVTFHQLDCRETICQLYLHTNDALAAQAVVTTTSESAFQIEHQRLAARIRLEDTPSGGTTYELLVRRDRPTWMPPHVPGAGPAYFQALAARAEPE